MAKTHVIDGVTYVEVERESKVGDIVWLVNLKCGLHLSEVNDVDAINEDIINGDVKVLEPLESEEVTVDTSQASKQVIEMFANISRRIVEIERDLNEYKALGIRDHLREGNNVLDNRVTSLEAQLRATQRNVETWAEQTESNTQDIAMLDERTYPKEDEITPDESIPQYWAEMLVKFYERRDR